MHEQSISMALGHGITKVLRNEDFRAAAKVELIDGRYDTV
jgi:hypothetical protein